MNRSSENMRATPLPWLFASGLIGLYGLVRQKKKPAIKTAVFATVGYLAARQATRMTSAKEYEAHASFAVNCTQEEAYQLWRDFENLPKFMRHLVSVSLLEDGRSKWTIEGPWNAHFHWTAEITEDNKGRRIAWRSLPGSHPGSQIQNSGSVEFREGPGQRGTLVVLRMTYAPPAGRMGKALAYLLGKDPAFTLREDLRRFKALIETGEIPTTHGQPHGPRGLHGRTHQMLLREKQNISAPAATSSLRRTA
jgi:uncharacterized membrane protein